jgi:hypothetical protein
MFCCHVTFFILIVTFNVILSKKAELLVGLGVWGAHKPMLLRICGQKFPLENLTTDFTMVPTQMYAFINCDVLASFTVGSEKVCRPRRESERATCCSLSGSLICLIYTTVDD